MKDEALKLALGALDNLLYWDNGKSDYDQAREAITAIKQALAAPVQEPVAWMVYTQDGQSVYVTDNPTDIKEGQRALPLYTAPPAQPAVPDAMTSADIQEHIEYVAGWNDCRQAMLEMMK
jgi:hypothetical protein